LLLGLLVPATAPAVSPLHSISVYGEGDSGKPLAVFATATCTRTPSKSGGGKTFEARSVSTDGKSRLFLTLPNFGGFKKEYEIEAGTGSDVPYVDVLLGEGDESATTFSSRYVPPAPIPVIGRALFREAGHLLGIGYGPAMYEHESNRAIQFTGVIECEKPKKGKKGKKG
jgi:hypothetical protein